MRHSLRLRAGLAVAAAVVAAFITGGPAAAPLSAPSAAGASTAASTGTESRVGLVVDTGSEVKRMCVTFPEEAISGADLLRKAGVEPVFADYSGKGTAVCSLCRTGCPANDCLTCDPDGRYWSYHRSPWGSTSYQYSRAGAGATEVRDGDVEAWAWGTGRAPAYVAWGDLCDGPAPTRSSSDSEGTSDAGSSGSDSESGSGSGSRSGSGSTSGSAGGPAGSGPSPPPSTASGGAGSARPDAPASGARGGSDDVEADSGGQEPGPLVGGGDMNGDDGAGPNKARETDRADEAALGTGRQQDGDAGSWVGVMAAVGVAGGLLTWAFVLRRRTRVGAGERARSAEAL